MSRIPNKIVSKQKLFFILSVIGILILLFLTTNQKPILKGIVNSINYETNRIVIQLEDKNQDIIIFENQILNIKQGQQITIWGKQEIYKNKTQILADKITCLNC